MFSSCNVPSDRKETELGKGSSDQQTSPSVGEYTGVLLVPWRAWKCVTIAISGGVDIHEVPGYHLLRQMSPQWTSQKLFQGSMSHELTAHISDF